MKFKIVLAAAALLLSLPSIATAQVFPSCEVNTLEYYLSHPCMFESALYENFTYSTPTTGGVTAAQITVDPVTVPSSTSLFVGLNFLASWSAAAHGSEQSLIGYTVVPFPPSGTTPAPAVVLTLDLGQSQVSGIIGSVTVQQTTTISTLSNTLEVFDTCADACGLKKTDTATVTGSGNLQVLLNVSLSGGTAGVSLNNFASNINLTGASD
jgi:hypothetical protein